MVNEVIGGEPFRCSTFIVLSLSLTEANMVSVELSCQVILSVPFVDTISGVIESVADMTEETNRKCYCKVNFLQFLQNE